MLIDPFNKEKTLAGSGLRAPSPNIVFCEILLTPSLVSGSLNIPSSKQPLHRIDDHCVIVSNALAPIRF